MNFKALNIFTSLFSTSDKLYKINPQFFFLNYPKLLTDDVYYNLRDEVVKNLFNLSEGNKQIYLDNILQEINRVTIKNNWLIKNHDLIEKSYTGFEEEKSCDLYYRYVKVLNFYRLMIIDFLDIEFGRHHLDLFKTAEKLNFKLDRRRALENFDYYGVNIAFNKKNKYQEPSSNLLAYQKSLKHWYLEKYENGIKYQGREIGKELGQSSCEGFLNSIRSFFDGNRKHNYTRKFAKRDFKAVKESLKDYPNALKAITNDIDINLD